MNQMLDDIEELNGRIMDSRKKLLELEYAKKQTEMIAYRSQYGSVDPAAIVGAGILATTVSTAVAVVFCRLMDRRSKVS